MADGGDQNGEEMAGQRVRIEIVPFPDASDESPDAGDVPAAEPVDATDAVDAESPRSGLTPVVLAEEAGDTEELVPLGNDVEPEAELDPDVEPEAEPEPETEPEPEAELDPDVEPEAELEPDLESEHETVTSGLASPGTEREPTEPVEAVEAVDPVESIQHVEGAEHDEGADPVDVPQPVAPSPRRRTPVVPTVRREPPAPIHAESDGAFLRGWSVSGRLLFLTLGAVVLAASMVIASVWGVARVTSESRAVDALADARRANSDLVTGLRVVDDAAGLEPASVIPRLESLATAAGDAARPWTPRPEIDAAEESLAVWLDSVLAGEASPEAFRKSVDARSVIDDHLRDRQIRARDRLESVRSSSIAMVMSLFVLGSLVLVLVGRSIGRSVSGPLRSLGRHLRRFGDGDLRSRATVAPDEIGAVARSFNAMAESVGGRVHRLNAEAERDQQLRLVGDALDLADQESDVYEIVESALAIVSPDNASELLVSEPASSNLWRASSNPVSGPAGCPVATAGECVAMRRAQAVIFDGPSAINACPQLRNHDTACSAACVPVGVNGQLLGVIHVTAPEHEPPPSDLVEQIVTLAGQVGVRVGAQRTLESTRLEASTDGLTGLANRRMLVARMNELLRARVGFSLAVADLDHFKQINDTYGHPAGDRALQVFAKVLEQNVRGHDLVARYGGEEFVLVYPELTVVKAMEVIERIRVAMERAIEADGLPPFTCSFGVTHSTSADDVEDIIRIADAGLLMAKELGRDRVVFADPALAAEVFGRHSGILGPTAADTADADTADGEADSADSEDELVVDLTDASRPSADVPATS